MIKLPDLFKTRHEVKRLRQDIAELRAMLVAHLGIKYTFHDFRTWLDRHPRIKSIPVKEGEWHHFNEMLAPVGEKTPADPNNTKLHFRDVPVHIDSTSSPSVMHVQLPGSAIEPDKPKVVKGYERQTD